jgi:hypothetical protein
VEIGGILEIGASNSLQLSDDVYAGIDGARVIAQFLVADDGVEVPRPVNIDPRILAHALLLSVSPNTHSVLCGTFSYLLAPHFGQTHSRSTYSISM